MVVAPLGSAATMIFLEEATPADRPVTEVAAAMAVVEVMEEEEDRLCAIWDRLM